MARFQRFRRKPGRVLRWVAVKEKKVSGVSAKLVCPLDVP